MLRLTLPADDMAIDEWLVWLHETSERDLPTARRMALLRLVWQEAHLTRQGLVARVESLLGRGCFGSSPRATFYRDMAAVRRVLAKADYQLAYSRQPARRGYFVAGRPPLDEQLQRLIAGAVAEVDPEQIRIYRQLETSTRVWQMAHLSDWLHQANKRRLRRRDNL